MKIYISGSISGRTDFMERFAEAEKHLISKGFITVNPTTLSHNHGKTYEEYMKEDIKALLDCDSICMIGDWKNSRGAVFEHTIAEMCGQIRIYGSDL